jgi:hypothetical protein
MGVGGLGTFPELQPLGYLEEREAKKFIELTFF